MRFPNISFAPTADLSNENEADDSTMDVIQNSTVEVAVETVESFCQTDIEHEPTSSVLENTLDSSRNTTSAFEIDEIKDTITQTIQDSIDKYLSRRQLSIRNDSYLEERESPVEILRSPPPNPSSNSTISMNGFSSKRKTDAVLESNLTHENSITPSKKAKVAENEYGNEYIEWLKDFVNVGPDN